MATGPITQVSDLIVPEVFDRYIQQKTEEKSRLIISGAVVRSSLMDAKLIGGALTFNMPSFQDLDNDEDNVGTDDADDDFTGGANNSSPKKIGTANEIAVRMNRNQNWSSARLANQLSGEDPLAAVQNRVVNYWLRRRQAMFVAMMKGIFADNDAVPSGTEHVQGDLTHDVSGGGFIEGVTNFTAKNFLGAELTMGDSGDALTMIMVHSIVYNTMKNNNLIDFVQDSISLVKIPVFMNRQVIVDDGVPFSGTIFESWLFGPGAVMMGIGQHDKPVAVATKEDAGNGDGQDILYNRHVLSFHPVGHAYIGTPANGGPSNAATSNNLANASSWIRVYTERKQIMIARLITRES